jgi:lipopolysaccharide transport system permease protein
MNELSIEAGKLERHYWLDLWRYRELFIALSRRGSLVCHEPRASGVFDDVGMILLIPVNS